MFRNHSIYKLFLGSYSIQRGAVASLVFATSLLSAKLLGPQHYGELAMFLFIAKSLIALNLGSVAGFFISKYTNDDKLETVMGYTKSLTLHLLLAGVLASGVGSYIGIVYALASVGFILLIPLYAIEPVSRVKRLFYVSLLPDVMLSVSAICASLMTAALYYYKKISTFDHLLVLVIFFMVVFYLVFLRRLFTEFVSNIRPIREVELMKYFHLIKKGFPQYVTTLAFVAFLSVDRIFLERYHSGEVAGVYLYSYQLSIGASLFVSAQSFVSGINIGEAVRDHNNIVNMFNGVLKNAFTIAVPSYIILIVASYLLEKYFLTSFSGLVLITSILGLGFVSFYLASNVTGIAFYISRAKFLIGGMVLLIPLSIVSNLIILSLGLDSKWVGISSGVALLFYSIFAIGYTYIACIQKARDATP